MKIHAVLLFLVKLHVLLTTFKQNNFVAVSLLKYTKIVVIFDMNYFKCNHLKSILIFLIRINTNIIIVDHENNL